ncbi:MAG: nitrophenyl compound nitroreductase subunit ArsF family protein [Candidatus Omnitrophica bacterium]|nr:nitrophenyl compound nitroreductase subunit ArsF family protein [Candidatus Omnitrophota bacterium]MDD5500684.1 nitrophenyl compound nitroreductase subunit ArsF family protein [Candidatus Omnitrophota bacterium]
MRKIIQILAIVAVISAGSFAFAQSSPQVKVIVYYFHGLFRCSTCMNMERYSREAVETNFKDALASEKLEFKAVNVEDQGNEHFVSDYKLYTKSLILSLVKDGKEVKSKNLDKIWEFAGNKQKFIDYVTGVLDAFMKDAQ